MELKAGVVAAAHTKKFTHNQSSVDTRVDTPYQFLCLNWMTWKWTFLQVNDPSKSQQSWARIKVDDLLSQSERS